MYRVVERFVSINGESRRAGELAVFIRFAGCNLNCSYCDTAWANERDVAAQEMTGRQILDYIESTGVTNVTFTGGEPLLQPDIIELIVDIISINKKVEVETNGAVNIEPLMDMARRLSIQNELSITLDYKCPGSGMEAHMIMENYDYLRSCDTVKMVVGSRVDLDRAREVIETYDLLERGIAVYLSPVYGQIESREIVEYMIDNRMNGVTHQLQQHKIIWDPMTKGV